MASAAESLFPALRERAWAVQQALARDEFLGADPDLAGLGRYLAELALVICELADAVGAK